MRNMIQLFSPDLAKKYGLHEAIFIEVIRDLALMNCHSETNHIFGRYWVDVYCDSFKRWSPYFSEIQTKKIIKKLKKQGILSVLECKNNGSLLCSLNINRKFVLGNGENQ